MPTTAVLLLPYPALTAAPNVPADIQAMADRLEALFSAPTTTAWVAPTLLNGWVDYGAPYQTCRYKKISGIVYVEGLIKNGTTTAATALFTLPAGFRPAATLMFPVAVSPGTAMSAVTVDSSGSVVAFAALNATYTNLEFSFPADA